MCAITGLPSGAILDGEPALPGRSITPEDRADDYPRAVLFMISAAVFLPLLNAAVKYLSGRYPVLELLWARYAGHLAFMLVVFASRRGLTLLRSTRPLLQVSRSTCSVCPHSACSTPLALCRSPPPPPS